ncbi:MAG TPA: dihydrolipoamide succinyltransferase, partial [Alphaproteobacteria bacterium]|nr:dihydrolipoamide succinyltransferase [Alphaproteobacteria bacterium]
MLEIKTPVLGESVAEATVAKWHKKAGEGVKKDELLVELETDKVTLEVNAADNGVLESISADTGASVVVGQTLGFIKAGAAASTPAAPPANSNKKDEVKAAPTAKAAQQSLGIESSGPAARKIAAETGVDTSKIEGTGKDGRITKGDILEAGNKKQEIANNSQSTVKADREVRVKMTKLRQTIAKRLKESQNTAAM